MKSDDDITAQLQHAAAVLRKTAAKYRRQFEAKLARGRIQQEKSSGHIQALRTLTERKAVACEVAADLLLKKKEED